eukprot:GHVU01200655.1.p2 GENE.GHVU01200655.1~~GHVU01200655.1.p2  ORF type:complete len:106 (-),score=12.75 GHVU01200655.1:437-754(-)
MTIEPSSSPFSAAQSRRDDIESLAHTLVYLASGAFGSNTLAHTWWRITLPITVDSSGGLSWETEELMMDYDLEMTALMEAKAATQINTLCGGLPGEWGGEKWEDE